MEIQGFSDRHGIIKCAALKQEANFSSQFIQLLLLKIRNILFQNMDNPLNHKKLVLQCI